MDVDPSRPKAVWGFNGTGRPGAVYLAAVLSAHAQKGLPAFGIYGEDVQDEGDTRIPDDVQEKLLRFARSGLGCGVHARTIVFVHGLGVDGYRRLDRGRQLLPGVSGHAERICRYERVYAPLGRGHL